MNKEKSIAGLPIAELPEGNICPPLEPDDPTWDVIAPWDDPLASRGGYRVISGKTRETVNGRPTIHFGSDSESFMNREDRMLTIGEPTWREYSLACRVQPLADACGPTMDHPFNDSARCGLVFRVETVRRHYFFCIENRRRLVLYRRDDAEWTELAGGDIEPNDRILTLRIELDGDGIRAECPECDCAFNATDSTFQGGRAGFRALGDCQLFSLDVKMTPGQETQNKRLADNSKQRTAYFSSLLPEETEVGAIDLGGGRVIVDCTNFCVKERNDLLFATPEGMVAETWAGKRLWEIPEKIEEIVFTDPTQAGNRILYGLTGKRREDKSHGITVQGFPNNNIVQNELVAIDGASGDILHRAVLPVSPREDILRKYDLSYETGRISGPADTDILVREWRQDWGGGGEMIWAYDGDLKPLWEQKVYPGYGHHNAVHFFDYDGDGRDEILAGGCLLSAEGDLIWQHDRAESFFTTLGGQHYDAAVVGHFADDAECDPVAFLIGGSAGVYVVDGRTGRTRAHHCVGHAQWALPCKVRDDLPGTEVMVGTRWGNYGILTLFSGRGDRLWSIQPDYILQGTAPVQWTTEGPQHIWCCRSLMAMGLYDGYGRMVKPLDKIRKLYGSGNKRPTRVLRRKPDGTDLLGVRVGDVLHLFSA